MRTRTQIERTEALLERRRIQSIEAGLPEPEFAPLRQKAITDGLSPAETAVRALPFLRNFLAAQQKAIAARLAAVKQHRAELEQRLACAEAADRGGNSVISHGWGAQTDTTAADDLPPVELVECRAGFIRPSRKTKSQQRQILAAMKIH